MKLKRLKNLLFLHLARLPMRGMMRAKLLKIGGVAINDPSDNIFIGEHVLFDTNHPELISIDRGVWITNGCVILSHFLETSAGEEGTRYKHRFRLGNVRIKENAFIGCNTVICNAVTIGKNAIVGASSVVTKDIPDNEVWAGNPAKFIKKRQFM